MCSERRDNFIYGVHTVPPNSGRRFGFWMGSCRGGASHPSRIVLLARAEVQLSSPMTRLIQLERKGRGKPTNYVGAPNCIGVFAFRVTPGTGYA